MKWTQMVGSSMNHKKSQKGLFEPQFSNGEHAI